MDNQLCHVLLKNQMEMVLSKDGWNPGEEVPAYYRGEVWTIDVDMIFAFREVTNKEWVEWKSGNNPEIRRFVDTYEPHRET